MNISHPARGQNANDWAAAKPPLLRFLASCHTDFSAVTGGAVANYIPELGKANPDHFGISLATLDGHVYEVGESRIPFTIQSMSKPFVFALALDTLGAPRVEKAIGVEPSGDPFNSIRLNAENHPFNPMVNAGATSNISVRRSAGLPGASSASTRPSMPPKARPAIVTAPSAISCATPTSSRITSARCWRFIFGNAPFW
jgi:Glutaminase